MYKDKKIEELSTKEMEQMSGKIRAKALAIVQRELQ
jgi:hypothetical protein